MWVVESCGWMNKLLVPVMKRKQNSSSEDSDSESESDSDDEKLQDDLQKLGLKIKVHEENLIPAAVARCRGPMSMQTPLPDAAADACCRYLMPDAAASRYRCPLPLANADACCRCSMPLPLPLPLADTDARCR